MRTRDKIRIYKKFMAGESVRDIAQARHLTIEEVENTIRDASVKRHLTRCSTNQSANKVRAAGLTAR
jgi:hypothetical protein